MILIGIALFWWGVFLISFTLDRSRYRNCVLLFMAISSSIPACCSLAGGLGVVVFALFLIALFLAILAVPIALIVNGIVMLRREGRSLANLLSLLLGLAIGVGEFATVIAAIGAVIAGTRPELGIMAAQVSALGLFVSVSVLYGSLSFLMFLMYSVFLMVIPKKRDFDYVIIHGAGLLEGSRISRLLADRLDKAISVYHLAPKPPILIPSGGKGDDEEISEAEAMAGYLREHDIPEQDILIEDRSETTYENLKKSMELIDSHGGRGYTALVTSNYHVYRALRYCRQLGFRCTGIGSRVAPYYWPSALIREYVAIHAEKKHTILFFVGWIICVVAAFAIRVAL